MPRYFTPLRDAVRAQAQARHLERARAKHLVLRSWPKALEAFVSGASSLTQAVGFDRGCLTIACLSSSVARQIRQLEAALVAALNRILGSLWVKNIEVVS